MIPASPGTFPSLGLWKGAGCHQCCLYPQHTPHTLGTLVSGSPWGHLDTAGGKAGTQSVIRAGRALILLHATDPIRQPPTCPKTTSCQPRPPPILHVLTEPKLPLCGFRRRTGQANCKIKNSSDQQCSLLRTGQLCGASSRALPGQSRQPCPAHALPATR